MSNYFVTYDFADQISGIEHAQIKRMQVFKKFSEKNTFIVTLAYNRFLSRSILVNDLNQKDVINMYDFFQNISTQTLQKKHEVIMDEIISNDEIVDKIQGATYRVTRNDLLTKEINLMVNPRFENQINYVDFFDANGEKIKTDYYDERGFKSMSDIFGQYGGVAREINFDLDGKARLESLYKRHANGSIEATKWILIGDDGFPLKSFNTKSELQSYFFDKLNINNTEMNLFVSDRAYLTDEGLINMQTERKLYIYWHNVFIPEGKQVSEGAPFHTLTNQIKNHNKIDGLLAPTLAEVKDLKTIVKEKLPVYKVNNSVIENTKKFTPFSQRDKNKIITIARISEEKRLDLGIEIFKMVHDKISDATWHIYGYNQNNNQQKLQAKIDEFGLENAVFIHGYKKNIEDIYNSAELLLLTSKFEGFNLSMLEAMSYGVPAISFNINYGPAELIEQAKNGYLINENDHKNLIFAKTIIQMLKNQFKLEQMGAHAFVSSQKYTDKDMWQQWLKLL